MRSELRLARQNTNDLVRKFENKLSNYGKKGYYDKSNSSGFTSSDNINTKKTNATSSHLETIKESKRDNSNYSPKTFEGKSRSKFDEDCISHSDIMSRHSRYEQKLSYDESSNDYKQARIPKKRSVS